MERNVSLDSLKFLMAIMVVGIHTSLFTNISGRLDFVAVNGLFRIAVPVFFIVSGYYFANVSTVEKLKTWVKRILLLYAFWMVVYLPFYLPESGFQYPKKEAEPLLMTLLFGYVHLWYVAAMIPGGLILYRIRNWSSSRILLIAIGLYCTGVLIQYIKYFYFYDISLFYYRNFLFFGLPMMILGFCASKIGVTRFADRTLVLALAVGILLLMTEVLFAYRHAIWRGGFDMYLGLIVITPAIFILIMKSKFSYSIKGLSLAPSVVYFSHVFFIIVMDYYLGWPHGMKMFLVTLSCTFIFALITSRFPSAARIVF